jgi:hypothetical protein
VINQPPAFVKAELHYLYQIGRTVETAVRNVVFREAVGAVGSGWSQAPDARIVQLVKFFAYFGYIETTTVPVGYSEPGSQLRQQQEREAERIHAVLLDRCIADLLPLYGP